MMPKKAKTLKPMIISDDKELIKAHLPALAMPNTSADALLEQLEGLMPKWKAEKVCWRDFKVMRIQLFGSFKSARGIFALK